MIQDYLNKNYIVSQNKTIKPINANTLFETSENEKVQVGKDQEKAQSEKDSHSKNRGGKKPN